ncbi:MAG: twin-arginine translocase subunit TatC [Bacillota bacterium]
MDSLEMTLTEHLTELRSRLIKSILAIVIGALGSYFFADILILYLTEPIDELVFIKPTEAFFTYIKVSLLAGLIIALPVVLYQFWSFILPALQDREKKYLNILLPVSLILFAVGIAFCFFIVLPLGMKFLLNFGSIELEPMISISYYISFLTSLLLPFGLIFQLPLVINLLVKWGLVKLQSLTAFRKYIVVIIFVVSAILTPPDIITQLFMAGPLIILYEGSILIAKLIN